MLPEKQYRFIADYAASYTTWQRGDVVSAYSGAVSGTVYVRVNDRHHVPVPTKILEEVSGG